MLCLSRKPNEPVHIIMPDGRQIFLTIIEVRGKIVKLGFEAPEDVVIMRSELLARAKESA